MSNTNFHQKTYPDYDNHQTLTHPKRLVPITLKDACSSFPHSEGQIVIPSNPSTSNKRYMLVMMNNTNGLVDFVQKLVKHYGFQVIAFGESFQVLQQSKIEVNSIVFRLI